MIDTQALADFGATFIAALAGRLEELSNRLDTAPPDLTRDDGRELAQVVADAFATGTGILQADVTADRANLARVDPAGVVLNLRAAHHGELEVAGRDLLPGDRLAGGQVADGTGLTVEKVLSPDVAVNTGEWVLLLTDGRPFVIDPDRQFTVRRP